MKRAVLLTILLLLAVCAKAQSRPAWTVKLPKETNSTYLYVCENAIAGLEKDARSQAIARVFQSTAMRLGVPFDSQKVFEAVQRGTELSVISRQYNIPIYKVCEHTERTGQNYRVYVLCQVAASGNIAPQFDYSFRGCYDVRQYNNWVALAKSLFIPGMGQMGKRRYGEGVFTLLGEVALVGGAIATYYVGRERMSQLASGSLNYQDYIAMQKEYSTLQTANTALWSAAAALYVFNLIRAVAVQPNYRQTAFVEPSYITTPQETIPSIGLTLKF